MTDRPIIFSAPMVRALLAGTKTQTRRLATSPLRRCEAGDRLYVRENWRVSPEACEGWHPDEMRGWIDYQAGGSLEVVAPSFDDVMRATFLKGEEQDWDFIPSRYRPCIHMPRWASRLTLIVEDVKVGPLNAISEADAIAEDIERIDDPRGVAWKSHETLRNGQPHPHASVPNASPVTSYRELWESLHGAGSWAENPDVLALTFRVVPGNIDQSADQPA